MTTWLVAALLVSPAPTIQPPAPVAEAPRKADSVIGDVTAIDAGARKITVKSESGTTVEVRADDKTAFLKARPGSSTLNDAGPVRLEDVAVGDRVLARGRLTEDKASLAARQVVVMTRGDISEKQEAERAEWRRRGILGVVSAVDPVSCRSRSSSARSAPWPGRSRRSTRPGAR